MGNLRRHVSPANVLSCLALFIALSGVAYAAIGKNAVKSRNIARNAVTTPKLKKAAVTAAKLRNGAVTSAKIANEAVVSAKLGPAAVRSTALGGGVVTTAKLKDGAVTGAKLQDGAVTGAKLASNLLAQLVKNVSYETKTSTLVGSETPKEATVECPAGKVAIGGGPKVIGGKSVALTDSAFIPPNAEGKRVGWTAAAAEMPEDATNWSLEVQVVCAEL